MIDLTGQLESFHSLMHQTQPVLIHSRESYFCHIPENTEHLYNICTTLVQRRRRWADVVQMLYKMFCVCWDSVSAIQWSVSVHLIWCPLTAGGTVMNRAE